MLIFLNESLTANLNLCSKEEIYNFEDLLLLHSKLLHYVAATKKTVNLISQGLQGKLSKRSQETLKIISTQSDNLAPLMRETRLFVEITKRELEGLTIERNNGSVKWICDLKYAVSWLAQPSKLIGENLRDVDIFKTASKYFAISKNLDFKMQKSNSEMTGGCGNAPEVLTARISDGIAPILCVIDSDKISPTHAASASIKKCEDIIEDMKGISYFHPLEEREIENIVPLSFLKFGVLRLPVSRDRDSILENMDILKSVYENESDVYKYIDIKNGTCKSWVELKGVNKFYETYTIKSPCRCKNDCAGFISPPLFQDILLRTSEYFNGCSEKNFREIEKDSIGKSWLDLGALVFSFALSNRVRTT